MNNKGRSLLILVIAFALLSLAAACIGFYFYQKERKLNTDLQEQLEELKVAQRLTESRLEESNRRLSELETKRKEAEFQITKLNEQLQQEKTSKEQVLAQFHQVKMDLEEQKRLRTELEKKLDLAQQDVKRIQAQMRELAARKEELEQKVSDLQARAQQSDVELGTIVVAAGEESAVEKKSFSDKRAKKSNTQPPLDTTPQVVSSTAPKKVASFGGIEGKILVVNRDYNFAVINLGSKDGVSIGSVFSIYHNNEYIGDAKVEKVHDSMAAGGFLSPQIRDRVSEGDRVVVKK